MKTKTKRAPRRRRARPLLVLGAALALGGAVAAGCDDTSATNVISNDFGVRDLSTHDIANPRD